MLKSTSPTPFPSWSNHAQYGFGRLTPPTSSLLLRRASPEDLVFSVQASPCNPRGVSGQPRGLLDEEDAVQGSAEYYTELRMTRFFEQGDVAVGDGKWRTGHPPHVFSHPDRTGNAVAYELELCRAEHLWTWKNKLARTHPSMTVICRSGWRHRLPTQHVSLLRPSLAWSQSESPYQPAAMGLSTLYSWSSTPLQHLGLRLGTVGI